jgi:hypothetical protein
MDGNPIKARKPKKSDDEGLKKPKKVFSAGAAKAILDISTAPDIPWLERWVEQLCRENSWPMQLLHNDFTSRLGGLLEAQVAMKVLERLRADYKAAHPFLEPPKDDFSFLTDVEMH